MNGSVKIRNDADAMNQVPVIEFIYLIAQTATAEAVTTDKNLFWQKVELYPAKAVSASGLLTANAQPILFGQSGIGASVTLDSLIVKAGIATGKLSTGHGFVNGQSVVLAGATPAGLNGLKTLRNVSANNFDFLTDGTIADGPATGTITAVRQPYTPDARLAADTNNPVPYAKPLGEKARASDIIVRGTATDGVLVRLYP